MPGDDIDDYCSGCGNLWADCDCLCSFCPFDGDCGNCNAVKNKPEKKTPRAGLTLARGSW